MLDFHVSIFLTNFSSRHITVNITLNADGTESQGIFRMRGRFTLIASDCFSRNVKTSEVEPDKEYFDYACVIFLSKFSIISLPVVGVRLKTRKFKSMCNPRRILEWGLRLILKYYLISYRITAHSVQ